MYARTKAWSGDDKRKMYQPEIYPTCIRELAGRVKEKFAAAAGGGAKL